MTNFKNNDRFIVSTLRTVPLQVTQTGTITTLGQAVAGVGTKFTNTNIIQVGDWIWNGVYELRKIIEIRSDTILLIEEGFTAELAGAVLYTIKSSRLRAISYVNATIVDATSGIDGVTVKAGEAGTWTKSSGGINASSRVDFIDPVVVDGTGSPLTILTIK